MDDLLKEFLTETNENLAVLDTQLVELEQNPGDVSRLYGIFRLVHTIKGTCGFLGLPRLESLAHALENVLGKFREGVLPVTPQAVSLILEAFDGIKRLLVVLEQTQREPEGDDETLIGRLDGLAETPPVIEAAPAAEKTEVPEPEPKVEMAEAESAVSSQSIRVNVDTLENLMTTVGELVLTRNQLLQLLCRQEESVFGAPLHRLNQITATLQDSVMKTRLQPIGNAWAKLPRLVRDLSVELGKKIEVQLLGADTGLDRQVLELIKDPLTHMVRNAADHGFETPQERRALGKPETGTLTLNAFHKGGHMVIEVSDDGRGLALDKIKAKALEKALASATELESMSAAQIQQFIFRPGFSTAAQITGVSGRGVGMDVVKTNIEKIGGTIGLFSEEGKGARFTLTLPLTLTIVPALIVEGAGQRFAVPQISVAELVRVSSHAGQRIEEIGGAPVWRLRGRLLPLVYLDRVMKTESPEKADTVYIVVMQAGSSLFGVVVDKVHDTEEIVVKPVSTPLRGLNIYSGNTLLGDGSVIMILDPNGLAAHAGQIHEAKETVQAVKEKSKGNRIAFLLFRAGEGTQKAVPLALVARLESIDMAGVEHTAGRRVVQYHGKLMPLLPVNDNFSVPASGKMPVLVFSDHGQSLGIIVQEILDIVEEELQVQLSGQGQACVGSAIIAGKATDIVDAGYFLAEVFGADFGKQEETPSAASAQARLLLVDDSAFFRNLLTPYLNVAGYDVTAVANAAQALALCSNGGAFDAIVSDLEMPEMDGFQFAANLRAITRWSATPLIALSSLSGQRDHDRCRKAGFTDHVAKFDRDRLLAVLTEALHSSGAGHERHA